MSFIGNIASSAHLDANKIIRALRKEVAKTQRWLNGPPKRRHSRVKRPIESHTIRVGEYGGYPGEERIAWRLSDKNHSAKYLTGRLWLLQTGELAIEVSYPEQGGDRTRTFISTRDADNDKYLADHVTPSLLHQARTQLRLLRRQAPPVHSE